MNVAVCVKQVPHPAVPRRLHPVTATLVRDGGLLLDDADAYGVETALRLVEEAGAGEVLAVSMAPDGEVGGLRRALAMGAHRAVLVTDDALRGSDALGTAKVLAAAIRSAAAALPCGLPDLVVAGTESTDGGTGTVGVQLAELLGLPSVTSARRVEVAGRTLRVSRRTEHRTEAVECPLPAVVTVTAGSVEPRFPSFKGVRAARTSTVEMLALADLGLDAGRLGSSGAGQEVVDVVTAEVRRAGEVVFDDGGGHEPIVRLLERLQVI